jgi:hypothetical protein
MVSGQGYFEYATPGSTFKIFKRQVKPFAFGQYGRSF